MIYSISPHIHWHLTWSWISCMPTSTDQVLIQISTLIFVWMRISMLIFVWLRISTLIFVWEMSWKYNNYNVNDYSKNNFSNLQCKVSFIILRHCRTHWLCWLCTWGGAHSLTKTLFSQSALCTFASAFTLVTLALCVKCRRTLKGTLHVKSTYSQPFFTIDIRRVASGAAGVVPAAPIFCLKKG